MLPFATFVVTFSNYNKSNMPVFKVIIEILKVVEISLSVCLCIMHHSEFSSEKIKFLSCFKGASYFVSSS